MRKVATTRIWNCYPYRTNHVFHTLGELEKRSTFKAHAQGALHDQTSSSETFFRSSTL